MYVHIFVVGHLYRRYVEGACRIVARCQLHLAKTHVSFHIVLAAVDTFSQGPATHYSKPRSYVRFCEILDQNCMGP